MGVPTGSGIAGNLSYGRREGGGYCPHLALSSTVVLWDRYVSSDSASGRSFDQRVPSSCRVSISMRTTISVGRRRCPRPCGHRCILRAFLDLTRRPPRHFRTPLGACSSLAAMLAERRGPKIATATTSHGYSREGGNSGLSMAALAYEDGISVLRPCADLGDSFPAPPFAVGAETRRYHAPAGSRLPLHALGESTRVRGVAPSGPLPGQPTSKIIPQISIIMTAG